MKLSLLLLVLGLAACSGSSDGVLDLSSGVDLSSASHDLAGAVDLATSDAPSGPAASCLASGGSLSMSLCCASVADYPNTCGIGACSCAPSSSKMVAVCNCPATKCFNGTTCQ